jgi:hypothetical protein
MTTVVACPRHGVLSIAADAPCPHCGVAAYDLGSRNARDVVRPTRALALKTRTFVVGAGLVAVAIVGGHGVSFDHGVDVNVAAWLVGGLLAAFAARPIAIAVERNPGLRALDASLAKHRD